MGPYIAHMGRVECKGSSVQKIMLPKKIAGDYSVFTSGDGGSGGALAISDESFSISKKTPESFVITSSNSRSRQTIDFLVIAA